MPAFPRRTFHAAVVGASATSALSASRVSGANDRVRVGFIGLGNRGDQVLRAFLPHNDCQVVALCDLYQPYLDAAAEKVGGGPFQTHDYRQLLERADVDAVVVATPDHWHALQAIEACQAGKDVYVEKPLGLVVAEGRRICQAAEKHQRVVQVGLQRRSSAGIRAAVEALRGGAIGQITAVRCFHIQNEWPSGIGNPPDGPPPADLDWNAWQGPAPERPFNPNRAFYRFRWFYDYSGGQVTNMGVHYLDVIQWALAQPAPRRIAALGGKYAVEDNREIPDTLEALWEYPGGTLVSFTQFNANNAAASAKNCDIEFRGTLGTLYLDGGSYEIVPERNPGEPFPIRSPVARDRDAAYKASFRARIEPSKASGRVSDADHARNFLDCVRSRAQCNSDPESGHRATTAAQLANIALAIGATLDWDAAAERITNHPTANERLSYEYRAPFQLPDA